MHKTIKVHIGSALSLGQKLRPNSIDGVRLGRLSVSSQRAFPDLVAIDPLGDDVLLQAGGSVFNRHQHPYHRVLPRLVRSNAQFLLGLRTQSNLRK